MDFLNIIVSQIASPHILFFAVGILAVLIKSDLKIPEDMGMAMMIFLLVAIGLKGGIGIAKAGFSAVLVPAFGAIFMGIVIVLMGFKVLKTLKFNTADAGAIAGHYGAVSAGTMVVGFSFLDERNVPYEHFVAALYPFMDSTAVITAIVLTRIMLARKKAGGAKMDWFGIIKDCLVGKSVLLLLASMAIGYISGEEKAASIMPFFDGLFKGVLALFMLEMGTMAAARLEEWKVVGYKLLAYALLMPIIHGSIGVFVGSIAGLSVGGATMLGIFSASASYISAPPAMRAAVPEANPSLSLTAAVALTFPFNVSVGVPLYFVIANAIIS